MYLIGSVVGWMVSWLGLECGRCFVFGVVCGGW